MASGPPIEVKVWGERACFTRPEMKVERVSYPVMTPSAARGVLEAIYWKPQFAWQVREIVVLSAIRHFSILRNEVNSVAKRKTEMIFADDNDKRRPQRAQRHTLGLRDVEYVIRADIVLRPDADKDVAVYRDQFRRRVERGACFQRPFLGCREFAADFARPDGTEEAIDLSDELGLMLFDLDYRKDGSGTPRFFTARLERGVLRVPPGLYRKEVANVPATAE